MAEQKVEVKAEVKESPAKAELKAKIKMYEEKMSLDERASMDTSGTQAEIRGLREQLNSLQ